MRLLFVNSAWPGMWGGGEKWTVEAAAWMRDRGHDVLVVGRPASRLIERARARGVSTRELRFRGDLDPRSLWAVTLTLHEFAPDLIVVNFNKEAFQFGLIAYPMRIPVLARHGFPLLRRAIHHKVLMRSLVDRLVVNAESIRAGYRALGYRVASVEVIHNGVVAPAAAARDELRAALNMDANAPLIAGAGRLESQKRFDLFLQIAARIRRVHPQARFVLFGEGPLRAALELQSRELGLETVLRLPGFVDDLASALGAVDLFLLTSEQEGTPNVLLEAMAAGASCLAFSVGSVPEILIDELAANRFPFNDVESMAARACALLSLPAERERLGHALREQALNRFSLDSSMARFESVFADMTERR